MTDAAEPDKLDVMAEEILELSKMGSAARSRRGATSDLTETEFYTLDALVREEPLSIGEIQQRVGVLPAQMSRVVRSLEVNRGKGYVRCDINADDRRRVDVFITTQGKKAYDNYRHARITSVRETMGHLSEEDQQHFMRIMGLIRQHLLRQVPAPNGE